MDGQFSNAPITNLSVNSSQPEVVSNTQPAQNQFSKPTGLKRSSLIKSIILFVAVVVFFSLILVGHLMEFGYEITNDIISDIQSTKLYIKDRAPLLVKTVSYKNNFVTPRKISLSGVKVCLTDIEEKKKNMQLTSSYAIETERLFGGKKNISKQLGQEVWIYPFSSLRISYMAKGDWYDYIYQYLDYDELNVVTTKTTEDDNCENFNSADSVEKIKVAKDNCVGCIKLSANGPDIAVIDFIANDNKIWEEGFISFVPIIKNIGTESAGPFEVVYYLNGNRSSSFQLPDLAPGEIVNNFIAGSGFQGNFGSGIKPLMDLKIEVKTLQTEDVDLTNNTYTWNFNYSSTPLPKHNCKFTDNNQGPKDFYSASSIDYSGKTYTDLCVDEKYLLEYVCDTHPAYNGDDNIEVFLYKCPSGCDQGTCIGEYTE